MYEAFQIIFGTHPQIKDFSDENTKGWSRDDKNKAIEFMKGIARFYFINGAVSLYMLLHPLHEITHKLQGLTQDIVQAHRDVEEVKSLLKSMRVDMDKVFKKIYYQSCRLAEKIDVEPT